MSLGPQIRTDLGPQMNPQEKIAKYLDENETPFFGANGEQNMITKLFAVAKAALKFRYERFGTAEKRCYTEQAKRELDKAFGELLK